MPSSHAPAPGLTGLWIDALMPLAPDHKVDLPHLVSHLRTLHAKGARHFVLFGLAGEGPSFSGREKLEAVRHLIGQGFEAKDLALGVSYAALPEAVALIRSAREAGVRHFLVTPPLHVPHPQHAGMARYVIDLLKALAPHDVQVHLHLLHQGSAGDLADAVVADILREVPGGLAGLIDQGGNAPRTQDRLRNFGAELSVGLAHEGHWCLVHTSGLVSALANVVPQVMAQLMASAQPGQGTKIVGLKERRPDDRLQELLRVLGELPTVPALKLLLSIMHRDAHWLRVRAPYAPLDPPVQEGLMKAFKTFNLQPNE